MICQDGVSKKVLTDQNANFTGTLMKIVARKFNIKQYRILVYYLQSNLQSNMGRLMRSLPVSAIRPHFIIVSYARAHMPIHTQNIIMCVFFSFQAFCIKTLQPYIIVIRPTYFFRINSTLTIMALHPILLETNVVAWKMKW